MMRRLICLALLGAPAVVSASPRNAPGLVQVNTTTARAVPQAALTFGKPGASLGGGARLCFTERHVVGQIERDNQGVHRCRPACAGPSTSCAGPTDPAADFWYARTNAFGWRHVANGEVPASALKIGNTTLCRAQRAGANPEAWILGVVQRHEGRNKCATETVTNRARRWVREARFDFIGRTSGQGG